MNMSLKFYCQGIDYPFEQKLLVENKICKVTIKQKHNSSRFDLIRSFEEIYEFDTTGNITFLTYWDNYIISDKTIETGITKVSVMCDHNISIGDHLVKNYGRASYISSSKRIKYNQKNGVSVEKLIKIYKTIENSEWGKDKPKFAIASISNCGMLVDTIFFGKRIKINYNIIDLHADSMVAFRDSLFFYYKHKGTVTSVNKYFLLDDCLEIQNFSSDSSGSKPYRKYNFARSGKLRSEMQGEQLKKFYYDEKGLLVKVEIFLNNNLYEDLILEYENCN